MKKRKLFWQLYKSYVIIIILSLVTITIYTTQSLRTFHFEEVANDLEARCNLLKNQFSDLVIRGNVDAIDRLSKDLGRITPTRITVISPLGKVLGDSSKNPREMDNHRQRVEVIKALRGEKGVSVRFSKTLNNEMMYVSIPLVLEGEIIAVLRTSLPLKSINLVHKKTYRNIIATGIGIALIAALVSFFTSRRITLPLREIQQGAHSFARGNFQNMVHLSETEEIGSVAEAMNSMASQIDEKIRTILRQSSEQEAILTSMTEGVIAIDNEERIIRINKAATHMLGINPEKVHGKIIPEVVRNVELQNFVSRTLTSTVTIEGQITVHNAGTKYFQIHGTNLRDSHGKRIGAVIVVNDISSLKKLENIRRDFVANVSHELKTPITSIKGFVETLQDGALKNTEEAENFLNIIAKQSDRLHSIIEDLLLLSKIERTGEQSEINLERTRVFDVLVFAAQSCELKTIARKITYKYSCEDDLEVTMNIDLMQQALINLIDNAIKYSSPGETVELQGIESDQEVIISVKDAGCGIASEHLTRIFERFYRVDRARSRKLGGTGLGLAIVKHIAQAHGGYVTVHSRVGVGSTFNIHLPKQ